MPFPLPPFSVIITPTWCPYLDPWHSILPLIHLWTGVQLVSIAPVGQLANPPLPGEEMAVEALPSPHVCTHCFLFAPLIFPRLAVGEPTYPTFNWRPSMASVLGVPSFFGVVTFRSPSRNYSRFKRPSSGLVSIAASGGHRLRITTVSATCSRSAKCVALGVSHISSLHTCQAMV